MKKISLLFLLTVVLLMVCNLAFAQSSIKLVYFENYAPFSWKQNDQMQGILIDVLTEAIERRLGIPILHEGYPWARAQMMVKDNKADAFATVPTSERKTYTEISTESVVLATFTLFIKKGNPDINYLKNVKTISDLKNVKLGHYLGSGWAKKKLVTMNVDWAATLNNTLAKLIKGRFDVFIDTSQVIRYNIKKLGYQDQIVELPNIVDSASFNLCIGKKSPYLNILPKFDETIRKMREDGKLQEIYNKYR